MTRILILLASFVLSQSAWAYDQAHLQRLLDTNSCPRCDLSNANLWGVDLTGANLRGANLKNTALAYANLKGADLTHTKWTTIFIAYANLTDTNIFGASLDCKNSYCRDKTKWIRNVLSNPIFCRTTLPNGSIVSSGCNRVYRPPSSQQVAEVGAATTASSKKKVWCATKDATWGSVKGCRSGVNAFQTETQAKAEHQRLKGTTTTSSSKKLIWCATKYDVWSTSTSCGSVGTEFFSSRAKAQAEHQRLKNQTTTVLTAESDSKPSDDSLDKSLDLEFWQSIKDSNDPDMFRAYLTKYPEGEFVLLAKININKLSNTAVANVAIPNLDYGNYHALVIGNNNYRHLSDLETAINDANAIGRVLKDDYGFAVKVLTNATRTDILDTFSQYRRKVSAKDNLLIYFAGHGHLDRDMDEGYWLPIDAVEDSFTNWISNSSIIASVRGMQAKHVMVVADSCFSGTLVRAVKITPRTPGSLQKFINLKARTALTSGGIEPVTDVGGGQHSVFARALLSLLEKNPGVMNGQELFVALRRQVQLNADQIPEYGDIRKAGHDGGDFLFVRQ